MRWRDNGHSFLPAQITVDGNRITPLGCQRAQCIALIVADLKGEKATVGKQGGVKIKYCAVKIKTVAAAVKRRLGLKGKLLVKKRYLLCWQIPLFSTFVETKLKFSCKWSPILTA
mgnify:CR=1 FL=1